MSINEIKLACFSDLHLELGHENIFSLNADADLLLLAGDIITFTDYSPLLSFLDKWQKPILYVAGNHEYYTKTPIEVENQNFRRWASKALPHLIFLSNEATTFQGVNFFGGTMWTDFGNSNKHFMSSAQALMNDFRGSIVTDNGFLTPVETVAFHDSFKQRLTEWFETPFSGPRVVITHHCPIPTLATNYKNNRLVSAYGASDTLEIIEKYQPALWLYGHTHECDERIIGKTKIISNQLGYPNGLGGFECPKFRKSGIFGL